MAKLINSHHLFVDGAQLQNAQMEQLAADPTGAGLLTGRIWFNTTDSVAKYYDGAAVQPFPAGSTSTDMTITESPTGATFQAGTGATDTLGLADGTNAGLLSPADFTTLGSTSGTNSGDQTAATVPSTASGNLAATNVQAALDEHQGDIDTLTANVAAITTSNAADNFISTAGTPTPADGVDGDYHLDVSTGLVTGPKAGGAWPANGNVGDAFGNIGLADAISAATATGTVGTATTAARSDHAHAPSKFVNTFGDGTVGPFTIPHGLGTANIDVEIRNSVGKVDVDYTVDAANIVVTPVAAVASNAYTVIADL